MWYIVGLLLAFAAVPIAAGSFRYDRQASGLAVGFALASSVLVFHTTLGNPGLNWIRVQDCCELALASLVSLVAVVMPLRRRAPRRLMLAAATPFLAVLALSITDAVGLTSSITGHLPGIGIALGPRMLSAHPCFFAAANYCSAPLSSFGIVAATAGTAGLLGVGVARRDRFLVIAAVASACLFAATFMTRDVEPCVARPRAVVAR